MCRVEKRFRTALLDYELLANKLISLRYYKKIKNIYIASIGANRNIKFG